MQCGCTYAVEFNAGQSERAKATPPQTGVLGPADITGCAIVGASFGLAHVTSPFDDELTDGRRVKELLVQKVK